MLILCFLTSCAESLEDQAIAPTAEGRKFEINLEERFYRFGYIHSNEDDNSRPNPSRHRVFIALTTDNVFADPGLLRGTTQLIGLNLEYSRSVGAETFTLDLRNNRQSGPISFTRVTVGEDHNFSDLRANRSFTLESGELTIQHFNNGGHIITLDSRLGGFPLRGSWTGKLREATFVLF